MKILIINVILLTAFIINAIGMNAQSNFEKAQKILIEAIEVMDNGNPDKAIEMLKEARVLDNKNYIYDYEIGYAQYIKRDFKEALKTYKYVVYSYDNITDQCYQMLGNLYDINGKPKKALEIYDEGLKKFPKSGRLFLEKGVVYLVVKKYNEALSQFEIGIKADPNYPSNYYRAALIYCSSSESIWGMIYGEIFINLERGTRRTDEMSKVLYNTYLNKMSVEGDTKTVSFSKNTTIYINPDNFDVEKFKLPFNIGLYEPTMLLSISNSSKLDLEELNKIRTQFLNLYNTPENRKNYPNALFDHQLKMQEYGHLEAYNYWVLNMGDEKAFDEWKSKNEDAWTMFLEWFLANPMKVDEKSIFHRVDY